MARPRSSGISNHQRGQDAEWQALCFLQTQGVQILARNVRFRRGEIDLIGKTEDMILFIEVKRRSHNAFGGAAASITRGQQMRVIGAARLWLATHWDSHCATQQRDNAREHRPGGPGSGTSWPCCRFDAILIEPGGLNWVRDAFRP